MDSSETIDIRPIHWGSYSDKQGSSCDALVSCVMRHAAFDGFGEVSLRSACLECGIDFEYGRSLFPSLESDMIGWHSMMSDSVMVEEYEVRYGDIYLPVHERIKELVMIRFRGSVGQRESIRLGVRRLLLPSNSGLSIRLLLRTIDCIWVAAGDTSTDWNFYTKRSLLAGVYLSVLPVYLSDESSDLVETEEFLLRRLGDVLSFGKWSGSLVPRAEECLVGVSRPFRFLRALSRYSFVVN